MSDQSIENIGFQPGAISPTCPNGQFYTIKSGDTMFFIAKRFNVSLQDLINANPQIPDPNTIFPGQIICIPLAPANVQPIVPPMAPCPSSQIYQVVSGDTMYEIARRYGITLDALIAANPQIPDPNLIYPGQEICIPMSPVQGPPPMPIPMPLPTPAPVPCFNGTLYTVRTGDTLFDIARANNILLGALIAANPQIPDPNLIYPGQMICIPAPEVPVAPPPVMCPMPTPMPVVPIQQPMPLPMPMPIPTPMPVAPIQQPMPMPLPAPAPIPVPVPVPCLNGTLYTVRTGDTLFDIARTNNILLAALIAANPQIPDPNLIYPGQVICIPAPEVPVAPPPVMCPMPTPMPVAPIQQPMPMPMPSPLMPCQPGPGMMQPMPVYIVIPWDECPHRAKKRKHERRPTAST